MPFAHICTIQRSTWLTSTWHVERDHTSVIHHPWSNHGSKIFTRVIRFNVYPLSIILWYRTMTRTIPTHYNVLPTPSAYFSIAFVNKRILFHLPTCFVGIWMRQHEKNDYAFLYFVPFSFFLFSLLFTTSSPCNKTTSPKNNHLPLSTLTLDLLNKLIFYWMLFEWIGVKD